MMQPLDVFHIGPKGSETFATASFEEHTGALHAVAGTVTSYRNSSSAGLRHTLCEAQVAMLQRDACPFVALAGQ